MKGSKSRVCLAYTNTILHVGQVAPPKNPITACSGLSSLLQ